MCRSMADIRSTAAEIRRGKKRKIERKKAHGKNIMSAFAMQGSHNKAIDNSRLFPGCAISSATWRVSGTNWLLRTLQTCICIWPTMWKHDTIFKNWSTRDIALLSAVVQAMAAHNMCRQFLRSLFVWFLRYASKETDKPHTEMLIAILCTTLGGEITN